MKTILLIEDYADSARLIKRTLEKNGHHVVHAPDGESGLNAAMTETPDVILLDLGLPDVDGQTLAGFLKNQPGLQDIPLIAVTAWPEATARQMAKAYGCDGYISKPIDVLKFSQQVAQYFT